MLNPAKSGPFWTTFIHFQDKPQALGWLREKGLCYIRELAGGPDLKEFGLQM